MSVLVHIRRRKGSIWNNIITYRERKSFYGLIERLRNEFLMLSMCICWVRLYACSLFFYGMKSSILSAYEECRKLRTLGAAARKRPVWYQRRNGKRTWEKGGWKEKTFWYGDVRKSLYERHSVNFIVNGENGVGKYSFCFLTDLPVIKKNWRMRE